MEERGGEWGTGRGYLGVEYQGYSALVILICDCLAYFLLSIFSIDICVDNHK